MDLSSLLIFIYRHLTDNNNSSEFYKHKNKIIWEVTILGKKTKRALAFIVLMGFVSLFSDIVYEGARSISGPFLGLLGASATVVAFTAGLGEFIGYALRLVTGYLAGKTKRYWLFTFVGYFMNLFAVPALALAGNWQLAVLLLLSERFGKAIRKPSRDTMMSYAAKQVGTGFGFGLEEALDQVGAISGPVILSLVLSLKAGEEFAKYKLAFSVLFFPALIAIILLICGRIFFPEPGEFEEKSTPGGKITANGFALYMVAISLIAAGFSDFPLISFHFAKNHILSSSTIPLFYSIAMAVDAVAALFFGKLFDKKGIMVLIISSALSALFAPLVFLTKNIFLISVGVSLWGIGMGAQESILKAVVANLVSREKRAFAYGIFNTVFGLFWFLGSLFMGILYEKSLLLLVIFSVVSELSSVFVLLGLRKH
jgi:hypothetical protein